MSSQLSSLILLMTGPSAYQPLFFNSTAGLLLPLCLRVYVGTQWRLSKATLGMAVGCQSLAWGGPTQELFTPIAAASTLLKHTRTMPAPTPSLQISLRSLLKMAAATLLFGACLVASWLPTACKALPQ